MTHIIKKTGGASYLYGVLAVLLALQLLVPSHAKAASTYAITPDSGTYSVGSTIRASLVLQAGGEHINAGEATLLFPPDLLTATSVSKGSVFTFWQTAPAVGNGAIRFVGGRTNSFTGNSTILTITFLAKKEGRAHLSVQNADILAADGNGTSVYGGASNAEWNITPAAPDAPLPQAPTITSPTHPDQNTWYSNNTPQFNWEPPSNTTAIATTFDALPDSIPQTEIPKTNSATMPDTKDGTWYMHVRLRNANGWGATAHFKVNIDTTAPKIEKFELPDTETTVQRHPYVELVVNDTGSGVGSITGQINNENPFDLIILSPTTFELPLQTPGKKHLVITVADKAGNKATVEKDFTVTEISPGVFLIKAASNRLYILIIIVLCLLILLLLLLLLLKRRRKDKQPPPPPPDNHNNSHDPPMYEVTVNDE